VSETFVVTYLIKILSVSKAPLYVKLARHVSATQSTANAYPTMDMTATDLA